MPPARKRAAVPRTPGGASSVVEQRTRLITEAEAVKETPLQPVGQSARKGATIGSNPLGGAKHTDSIPHHQEILHMYGPSTLAPCGTGTDYKPRWTILVSELNLDLERVDLS